MGFQSDWSDCRPAHRRRCLEGSLGSFQFTRRNTIRQRVVTLVGFILALLAIVAFWMAYRAKASAREANRQLADVSWQLAQQARGLPFAADEISPINATHHFLMAAAASKACGHEPASRNAILAARASSGHLLATILHGGGVNGVTDSPDGQRILSSSEDGTARLWEPASGAPVGQPMQHEGTVSGAVFSWDGQRILS